MRIVEVETMSMLLSCRILTDEQHVVTASIDGQVTGTCQSLHNAHFLCCNRNNSRMADLTDDSNTITGHSNGDDRILTFIEIRFHLSTDNFLALSLCQSLNMDLTHNREIDVTIIVNKITLQRTGVSRELSARANSVTYRKVEWRRSFRVGCDDRDSQHVFRHNLRIVQSPGGCQTDRVNVLEISNFLAACT